MTPPISSSASVLFLVLAASAAGTAADKPRVFITESGASMLSGKAAVGEARGTLELNGGTSPQNIEVIKSFQRHCPAATITGNREKADFLVRFDHEEPSPVTPFVKGNKVAVFNKDEDVIYSHSTRLLGNAVKGACAAITQSQRPAPVSSAAPRK